MPAMNQKEFFKVLKSFVEGKLAAADWIDWWNKNRKAVAKLVDANTAKCLAPRHPDSPSASAYDSHLQAVKILKAAGVPARASNRYFKEFRLNIKDFIRQEDARDQQRGDQLKTRIEPLKAVAPNLHACLHRNSKKLETFEPGASEKDIARLEKALKVRLPKPIRDFFRITKHFSVEGFELDLDQLFMHPGDGDASDGNRYLCLGNYFWKADGDQILVEISAPAADPKILYYAHSAPTAKIRPLAASWKEFLEKLPKQYLNRTFYYM